MVSIVPNLFKVEGTLVSKEEDQQLPNFITVVIRLHKTEHLDGPEDFLDPSSKEVAIRVMDTVASKLKEGMHVECKIRKTPGHFMVIPDSIKIKKEK